MSEESVACLPACLPARLSAWTDGWMDKRMDVVFVTVCGRCAALCDAAWILAAKNSAIRVLVAGEELHLAPTEQITIEHGGCMQLFCVLEEDVIDRQPCVCVSALIWVPLARAAWKECLAVCRCLVGSLPPWLPRYVCPVRYMYVCTYVRTPRHTLTRWTHSLIYSLAMHLTSLASAPDSLPH